MKKKNYWGMTLTEVLVVTGILVALIMLIMTVFQTQIFKGRDAKRKGDLHLIQEAVEEYEKDHNCYPPANLVVCRPGDGLMPYLSQIPCDPATDESYYYEPEADACPGWYRIFADLENEKDSDYLAGLGPAGAYSFIVLSPNAPQPTPQATATPTTGSTATPGPTPPESTDYYGCKSGVCVPIAWDPTRPGPECDPNFVISNCSDSCLDPVTGEARNECVSWK